MRREVKNSKTSVSKTRAILGGVLFALAFIGVPFLLFALPAILGGSGIFIAIISFFILVMTALFVTLGFRPEPDEIIEDVFK